jgi:hypothetical protein
MTAILGYGEENEIEMSLNATKISNHRNFA